MASILFASTGLGDGCSAGIYQTNCKKHKQKFFFISIHKPVAYELSYETPQLIK
jgi:hypothetical protein